MTAQRNYAPGTLRNAQVGKALYPQAQVGGSTTYRPAAAPVETIPTCSATTKRGFPCMAYPGEDGLCVGHRKQVTPSSEEPTDG